MVQIIQIKISAAHLEHAAPSWSQSKQTLSAHVSAAEPDYSSRWYLTSAAGLRYVRTMAALLLSRDGKGYRGYGEHPLSVYPRRSEVIQMSGAGVSPRPSRVRAMSSCEKQPRPIRRASLQFLSCGELQETDAA